MYSFFRKELISNGIIILFVSYFSRDITYEISVEAVSTMVVFLSCQLFHKEVLRQSISHKYLMQGRWYVSLLHFSTSQCLSLYFWSCPLTSLLSQLSSQTFPSVILSTLQTQGTRNQILLSCFSGPSFLPLSSPRLFTSLVFVFSFQK